jgi:Ca2+-binding EF-hand superfamily protein
MSSISSLSSIGSTMMTQGMQRQRPNPTQMAENLFSQIDTSSQGYIEKADLQAALDKAAAGSSSSVDDLFTKLDSNSDGKVTKQEFSDVLTKLAEQMDQKYSSMRMSEARQGGGMGGGMGGPGGMPPPPPSGGDVGFTKKGLSSQLKETGESDSQRSSLIANFDKADTDGDGKVSFKESMAFQQSSSATAASTSTSDSATTTTASDTDSEARLMLQIMRLMQAYDIGGDRNGGVSTLSVTA